MALRGTLKDFGIADIFQLIGHQNMTGILTARHRAQRVMVHFRGGAIVHAEAAKRQWQDLLGSMLLRAEALTAQQLERALAVQKDSHKRLGDILVAHEFTDAETLRTFTRLQTTETVYQLFLWDGGSYEFEQVDVRVPESVDAVRSDQILMEGFRQVDEWPAIRKKIRGYNVAFRVIDDLERLLASSGLSGGDDFDYDSVFGGGGSAAPPKTSSLVDERLAHIGENERIVYRMIESGRDVQKIIDLSRLGEFDTCRALANLLDAKVIAPSAEDTSRRASAAATVGGISARRRLPWIGQVATVVVAALVLGSVGYGATLLGVDWRQVLAREPRQQYVDLSLQVELSRGQMERLKAALEVYKALNGAYPSTLEPLAAMGLVTPRDLRFPWVNPYYYALAGKDFVLIRPLF